MLLYEQSFSLARTFATEIRALPYQPALYGYLSEKNAPVLGSKISNASSLSLNLR